VAPSRLYVTPFTIPAGTTAAAPVFQAVTLDDIVLDKVRLIIPDGVNGLAFVAAISQGVNIVPYAQGTFITGNDEPLDFDYGDLVQQHLITLTGYNLDVYPHTFTFRWFMSDRPGVSPVVIASPQAGAAPAAADVAAIANLSGATPDGLPGLTVPADAASAVLALTGGS
jgi:hypothetical protein